MPTFRVTRDGSTVEDTVFDVSPLVDTANPFGDYVVIKMDDRGGTLFDQYERGTRVDVDIDPDDDGANFIEKFTGYVVERRETEQSGADVLEVEAYSFDQFLRRNTVTNDQTGNLISEALADIIQTDTPVSYVAGNVDVGDDQELTRTYQGRPVETVLRDLAFKSNNEDFGVNDQLEFFFQERETTHIDRGVDDTQWFNYDIPELGKEAINEVEVWFNDGEESVIVDDGTDKLDLQDSLGLPSPGTQRAERNRPLITSINDAEDIGRKYLTFRSATLSGTVTTFGLFEAEPGDTIDIQITARGIDAEFVIAATEYRWAEDETVLTIVEKRGDVDDILTELNDSVQRQEMEGANRQAPSNRITTTNAGAVVSVAVDAGGTSADADRFVNPGRRAVRDAWTGETPPDITTLVVGTDGAGLSRSNTALRNQTTSASVTETLPDAKTVEYSATVSETGVEEIGLEAADGTLITRATFDPAIDLSSATVTVTLSVANDDSVSRGVLTNDGQTGVRDVLANNSPNIPTNYAYGSDGTAVAETDTALGTELVDVSLSEVLIQDADSESEWNNIVDTTGFDTLPITVTSGGALALQQSAWTREGEDFDRSETGAFNNQSDYSNGSSYLLSSSDTFAEWDFTTNYTIPEAQVGVACRIEAADFPAFNILLDGTEIYSSGDGGQVFLGWNEFTTSNGPFDGSWTGGDLEPGEHTLRVEYESGTDSISWDVVAPYDKRYSYTFDNSVDADGYLSGPELYPSGIETQLATATTRRNVSEANFDLTANDVSNNFYVELANDGSTYTRVSNSSTGSVTFASPDRDVDSRINIGRYGSRSTATPTEGYLGQSVDVWNLSANPDAVVTDNIGETLTRAVVAPNTIDGQTVREAGIKSNSTLLTRHVLAEFEVLADQRLSSSETTTFTSDN